MELGIVLRLLVCLKNLILTLLCVICFIEERELQDSGFA